MEPAERSLYNAALVYEGVVGPDEANAKPFRGLSQGEKDKYAQAARNVLAGMSGADDSTVLNGAPNAFALPTVDPVTGERLQYADSEKFGDVSVAQRAGLTAAGVTDAGKFDTGEGNGSDTSLGKGKVPAKR